MYSVKFERQKDMHLIPPIRNSKTLPGAIQLKALLRDVAKLGPNSTFTAHRAEVHVFVEQRPFRKETAMLFIKDFSR